MNVPNKEGLPSCAHAGRYRRGETSCRERGPGWEIPQVALRAATLLSRASLIFCVLLACSLLHPPIFLPFSSVPFRDADVLSGHLHAGAL